MALDRVAGEQTQKIDVVSMEGGNVSVQNLWKGENEPDGEFSYLRERDPLETAGCWTREEAVRLYQNKLFRLLSLYTNQMLRLRHVIREQRRAFLIQWQREGGSRQQAREPSTSNSKIDIAYRSFGKRRGEEALLAWKRKKKRIVTTVKLIESGSAPGYNSKHLQFINKLETKEDFHPYSDCYVPDCKTQSVPHSGYCYKHILYDPKQHLFTQCSHRFPSREKCINPLPKFITPSYCTLHYHHSLIKATGSALLHREASPTPSLGMRDADRRVVHRLTEDDAESSKQLQDDLILPADITDGLMPLVEREMRSEDFQSLLDMVLCDQPDLEQGEKCGGDLFGSKLDTNRNNNRMAAASGGGRTVDNQLQQLDSFPLPADIDTSMLNELRAGPLPEGLLALNFSPNYKLRPASMELSKPGEQEELKQFEAKLQEQRLKGLQGTQHNGGSSDGSTAAVNGSSLLSKEWLNNSETWHKGPKKHNDQQTTE